MPVSISVLSPGKLRIKTPAATPAERVAATAAIIAILLAVACAFGTAVESPSWSA